MIGGTEIQTQIQKTNSKLHAGKLSLQGIKRARAATTYKKSHPYNPPILLAGQPLFPPIPFA